MSPETIELTLRVQEVLADSRRVFRQTAENFKLTQELRKRAERAMLGLDTLLHAWPPSEMQIADWYRPTAQASFWLPGNQLRHVTDPAQALPRLEHEPGHPGSQFR
jgi:hypothetical protein